MTHDAILIVSFGGPEGPDEVMPFLKNVVGDRVPEARLRVVAEHYHHFGGVSPINQLTSELIDRLREELAAHGPDLPVYWGNRFWRPHLVDTVRQMRDDGITRAVALATSALSSASGCRRYLDDLDAARAQIEGAPVIEKIRPFSRRPGYVDTCVERLQEALEASRRDTGEAHPEVLFTAHSIPVAMAATCDYVAELEDLAEAVSRRTGVERWRLVYQSRSGPPHQPWLEPDILAALDDVPEGASVVVAPFGFIADHMEVAWDLDVEAAAHAAARGIRVTRAPTAGSHPRFVRLLRDLVAEHVERGPDPCPPGCCS
ncbi:MAG: ferrochelatase [Sandaracinaceae bacterium]|nr:ferrochelatase [Sandaracinaceae bacterium]